MTILITSASSSKQFLMLKFKTTNYTRIKRESFESELKKKLKKTKILLRSMVLGECIQTNSAIYLVFFKKKSIRPTLTNTLQAN
jgi:hypothetical protein